jgi:hypothetical protein
MTMASMNAAGFQQSMGHPVMSSGGMPQVWLTITFFFYCCQKLFYKLFYESWRTGSSHPAADSVLAATI